MQDYSQALAFINALTGGQADTELIDFRAIHDADKARPAIPFRDTIAAAWSSICHYNNQGYGIFATIAQMDGNGRELRNVQMIRANYVDLDNISARQNLDRAAAWSPAPSFAVNSSPEKFHVYWPVVGYQGNNRFELLQRKLRQFFDGDKQVIDATRVMRVPGTISTKYSDPASSKHVPGAVPHMVSCFALPGFGQMSSPEMLETVLAGVNVIDGGGTRHELGDPTLAAPSLEWIKFALQHIDPNSLDRGEWISITAAIKQSGWSVAPENELFNVWSEWCQRYSQNDAGENLKQWNSIRQTEIGWKSIKRRVPILQAYERFGAVPTNTPGPGEPQPLPTPPPVDLSGEILSAEEQRIYFDGCIYVESKGEILTPKGRFATSGKFNGEYGGKQFVISSTGKTTDEAWKAALRSTLWTVPKVDHIRFVPNRTKGEIIIDQLGRKGVNVYIPITPEAEQGDVTPFLRHMELLFPSETDRHILYRYFAHNVRYPGVKIPWAPLIQGAEGIGKQFFQFVMEYALGQMYCYSPKAQELVNSGSTFNAWMRWKLFIVVNEIKVDERRELVEILKPMITDARVEIQSKGVDQDMEDNPANWLFFSNYKNAIPINSNGRRYSVFYSAIQQHFDLVVRGMDDTYFNGLFQWLINGGHRHVTHWLLNYPVEVGGAGQRAPVTSSMPEALAISSGPIEQLISEAIEDKLPGFNGGYVSLIAVARRMKTLGQRAVQPATIATILESMGFVSIGRAVRPYLQEDINARSQLFHTLRTASPVDYGRMQGYE